MEILGRLVVSVDGFTALTPGLRTTSDVIDAGVALVFLVASFVFNSVQKITTPMNAT